MSNSYTELNQTENTAYQNRTRTELFIFVTAKNTNQTEPLCLIEPEL